MVASLSGFAVAFVEYALCVVKRGGVIHVRRLSTDGRKLGGPCDTTTLCGRYVGYDLGTPLSERNLRNTCGFCRTTYAKLRPPAS